jgi:hypothetical protein
MAWAVASFFYGDDSLIDIDTLFTLRCGSTGKMLCGCFYYLAERKGNILNKQTDGKWEHATYAGGNDM